MMNYKSSYTVFVCLMFALAWSDACAQRKFTIPPREVWYKQSWIDSVYKFPKFQDGHLEFVDGTIPSHSLKLNFNLFLGTFMIKQDDGRLVQLDYSNQVKYVWIGDHKFFYTKLWGYLEVVQEGRVNVAESAFLSVEEEYDNGHKDQVNALSDNRVGTSVVTRNYWEERTYFVFIDQSQIHRSSISPLLKMFPKEKATIKDFAKNNHTDFKKKDDLMKIVLFCNREL